MTTGALKRVLIGLIFFAIVLVLGYFLFRARRSRGIHAINGYRHLFP
jgi:hypothetical protein